MEAEIPQRDALIVRALARVLEAWPHERETHQDLLLVAEQAEREGRPEVALEALGACVRFSAAAEEPRRALHRLALALSSAGRFAEALRALELYVSPGRADAEPAREGEDWMSAESRALRLGDELGAALRVARAQLERADLDALASTLGQLVQHAPAEWDLASVVRPLRIARTPGIFLCTLPKSGSVYVQEALSSGLDKPILHVGAGGFFPQQAIAMGCLQQLAEQRAVYMIHAEPSRHNRIELSSRLDRMLIQVRDPRQVLLSWAHFIPEVVRRLDPPQALHYGTPLELFERPFEAQLDWHIEQYLPRFVSWIAAWVECARDPEFKTQILFVTTEELGRDPVGFFGRVLDFYGIDRALFRMPAPPALGRGNVRSAQMDEWRGKLTPAQIERCSELLPAELCARFGWPVA